MVPEVTAVLAASAVEVPIRKTEEPKRQEKGPPPVSKEVPKEKIQQLVEDANTSIRNMSTRLSFTYDSKAERNIIRIVDSETGKVIRQIPPEEMIRLSEHIKEVIGALVDKHA